MYVSNPQNGNVDDFPFYSDQMLIAGRQIYHVNDYIVERLKNGLIIDIYKTEYKKDKSLV